MQRLKPEIRAVIALIALALLIWCPVAVGLDSSLDISQYAHNAWTVRDGFSLGNIYAIAQTPDGYLWLGTEFGLFRYDGVRTIAWQPPAGQQLPDKNINALLATRDGILWIGTFAGLATWDGRKLTRRQEFDGRFVESLFEDHEGTVWAGALFSSTAGPHGLLCAMRSGSTQCYGEDGTFGIAVPGLYEDSSGTLWVLAQSGLWRWKPGPPRRYATTPMEVTALSKADDGRPLIAVRSAGLMQLVGDKVELYPIRGAINPNRLFRDQDVNSNKLLRDRDGGLWIGTVERGLIHVHHGRTDVFTRSDGLSGDVVLSLFEDREGNIWVASTGGLDRFRELPVATISVKQGLSSEATQSVMAARDGSIWVGSHDGLTWWKNGQTTIFRKASGLPDDEVQSLFQDGRGRVWASTDHKPVYFDHGLAYFKEGRFVAVNAERGGKVHFITGDKAGNFWLSETQGLVHLLEGRLVEQIPWSELGRHGSAQVLISGGEEGGVWLGFGGGVSYFKNHQLRASYTTANGLGEGHVADLQLDRDGVLWAATQGGGLSRIKDGRIVTLTSRNGLPCDTIHWSIEDDDRSLWLYTGCGLVRITRTELEAWIADPQRKIETTVWDAADGVRLRSSAASTYGPRVAKSSDGKLWFVTGLGVQVVNPHHLAVNSLAPPVRIEQIVADHKIFWRNITGEAVGNVHLPARIRDLTIDYTALSLVAPEKVHFKYKLEGQDPDWREVVNDREVQYSNLAPGPYRFRVIASNNSGIWNERGDTLDFSIAPAYYQTNWFRAVCVAACVVLLWVLYQLRFQQLKGQERKLRDVVETIPQLVAVLGPDRKRLYANRPSLNYLGLTLEEWQATSDPLWFFHPDDRERLAKDVYTGKQSDVPHEFEARFRGKDGTHRWFLFRDNPLRDEQGRIMRWYLSATDIEDRKRAEQEREKLHELEATLAHINRVSVMGEMTASIAHEINQPLSGVVSNGSACLRWLSGDFPVLEEAREAARRIVRDGKRAGEIIARVRALARKTATARTKLDVNETVREVIALIADEAKKRRITVRTDFAQDLAPVLGDRVQLQQVVLNIVMNAMDAMNDTASKLLEIATNNDGGSQVQVTVRDTGTGFDPDAKEKIFEPFYSTKSGGMGMGLSISRSIVQSHGGKLSAAANEGAGVTVQFTVPEYKEGEHVAGT